MIFKATFLQKIFKKHFVFNMLRDVRMENSRRSLEYPKKNSTLSVYTEDARAFDDCVCMCLCFLTNKDRTYSFFYWYREKKYTP